MKSIPDPILLVSRAAIQYNAERMRRYLRADDFLLFAVKAFLHAKVVAAVRPWVDGWHISSPGEQDIIPSDSAGLLSISSAYGPECFNRESQPSPIYNVQTTSQLTGLLADACSAESKLQPGLRVRIGSGSRRETSRFGLSTDEIMMFGSRLPRFTSIHMHSRFPNEVCAASVVGTLETMKIRCGLHLGAIKFINLGGGWNDARLKDLSTLFHWLDVQKLEARVVLEPGSAFFDGACFLKVTVLDRLKTNCGVTELVTNISPDMHLKWSNVFGVVSEGMTDATVRLLGPTSFEDDISETLSVPETSVDAGRAFLLGGYRPYSFGWQSNFQAIPQVVPIIID